MNQDKARKVLSALNLAIETSYSESANERFEEAASIVREEEKGGWMPIETAPKDGTAIMLGARCGAWIGKYLPVYQSGFKPDNPWSSLMLNHDHLYEKWQTPTHWMPLPPPPALEKAR